MNEEIEKGKAIIQLAQIFMILSGFLFATGGIAYTNSINSLSYSLNSINQFSLEIAKLNKTYLSGQEMELLNETIEANSQFIEVINPQLDFTKTSFMSGWVIAVVAFMIWNIGYWKIKKSKIFEKSKLLHYNKWENK